MGPSGKRSVGNADRLSDLPDGLIHNIMSFLTAREAVQTCVLSRRWEDLWCSMPCLDIDEREFLDLDIESEDEDGSCHARFEDFVNALLLFHSAPTLDSFRFHHADFEKSELVNRWLRRGIKRCPNVVEICSHYCELPHLGSNSSRLKRLHLTAVTLGRTFTQQLRSGCPVLDDLELKFCRLPGDAEIVSCTLKNLTIEECVPAKLHSTLIIKAPSLAYLQLVITAVRCYWDGVVVSDMPFLIKATICLTHWISIIPKMPCKLLLSLINVKDLKLTGSRTLANLHVGSDTFPVFHNIRTLMFEECDLSDNFEFLGCFLSNAPCLEKLTLQRCKLPQGAARSKTGADPKATCLEYQDTPTFDCPSLKWTEIKYKEDGDVQKLFDLLLGVWKNLQKTTIVIEKA